jgi:hypothetical protein
MLVEKGERRPQCYVYERFRSGIMSNLGSPVVDVEDKVCEIKKEGGPLNKASRSIPNPGNSNA